MLFIFGTLAGGLGAELSGGNFWQGAATGLLVSGLNHFVHSVSYDQQDPLFIEAEKIAKQYGLKTDEVYYFLKSHPIVENNGKVTFKGINDIYINISDSISKDNSNIENKVATTILNKAAKALIGKIAGQIFYTQSLNNNPGPMDGKLIDIKFYNAKLELYNYMFMVRSVNPQINIPYNPQFYRNFDIYKSRY